MNNTQNTIYPLHLLTSMLKKHFKKIILLVILIMFLGVSASVNAILLKNIIDAVNIYVGNNLLSNILSWIIIYILWLESLNTAYRLYDYVYMKTMPQIKGAVIEYF